MLDRSIDKLDVMNRTLDVYQSGIFRYVDVGGDVPERLSAPAAASKYADHPRVREVIRNRRIGKGPSVLGTVVSESYEPQAIDGREFVYVAKDIFSTYLGSWEPKTDGSNGDVWGIDAWAREAYLLPWGHPQMCDTCGGDHHIFVATCDSEGEWVDTTVQWWGRDGFVHDTMRTMHDKTGAFRPHGRADLILFPSSGFNPANQVGWFCGGLMGVCEVRNMGMPNNHHVAWHCYLERVDVTDWDPESEPGPQEPEDPPTVPPDGGEMQIVIEPGERAVITVRVEAAAQGS